MTDTLEFKPWPKIPRLNKSVVITEKIDGTNGCVIVDDNFQVVGAQSRSRLITPQNDNMGFARWVFSNPQLGEILGPGYHYGEWWGLGIQRGYGLKTKKFSLFNSTRWLESKEQGLFSSVPELDIVPILGSFDFDVEQINSILEGLKTQGSVAAPGFMNPEGVVLFHQDARAGFKILLENNNAARKSSKEG